MTLRTGGARTAVGVHCCARATTSCARSDPSGPRCRDATSLWAGGTRRRQVWTAKHPGNVDLVRKCIDGLPDWREEPRAEAKFGASCQIVWVSKAIDSIRATGKFETVAGTLGPRQIISRFEGMRQGSTRERNSQLQRLRSRPFSSRFG